MDTQREELGDYEVPFKGIVEQSIAGIYILQDGRFQYVNETFAHMCGLRREQLMGALLREVANPEQAQALMAQYERRITGDAADERFIIRRTSQRRPGSFEIHGTRVLFQGRPAIVGVGIDITEQERQRGELEDTGRRLQELVANANSVRENERKRVARELHDVIGGMLTAIKFDLTRLSWGLERVGAHASAGPAAHLASQIEDLETTVAQLIALTQETVDAARAISDGLRPGSLDHLGLQDTLVQELQRFQQRYGIQTHFGTSGAPRTLDAVAVTDLYRIVQEALTNVARHAKATEVAVTVDWSAQELRLQVADNGLGFRSCRAVGATHLGLLGMRERARELGGTVAFGKGPKSGASVQIRIALRPTEPALQGDMPDDPTARG